MNAQRKVLVYLKVRNEILKQFLFVFSENDMHSKLQQTILRKEATGICTWMSVFKYQEYDLIVLTENH